MLYALILAGTWAIGEWARGVVIVLAAEHHRLGIEADSARLAEGEHGLDLVHRVAGDHQQADVDRIAEENARERPGDHRTDADMFDNLRSLLARKLTTVLTAGGMALVVYVFVRVL